MTAALPFSECCICLEQLNSSDTTIGHIMFSVGSEVETKIYHLFHTDCFKNQANINCCPLCRRYFTTKCEGLSLIHSVEAEDIEMIQELVNNYVFSNTILMSAIIKAKYYNKEECLDVLIHSGLYPKAFLSKLPELSDSYGARINNLS